MTTETINITHRCTGAVLYAASVETAPTMPAGAKLGAAVLLALAAGVNLREANLREVDLREANLREANLREVDLQGADLHGADMQWADLREVDLYGADLRGADLYGADLRMADLRGVDLRGVDLRGVVKAELPIAQTRILPEGSLIGWKKCRHDVIVKLRIPEEAKRSHAFGRKCRAEFADVLEVIGADVGVAKYDGKTTYCAGERVTAPNWSDDWVEECAGGIHFFITRAEAEAY